MSLVRFRVRAPLFIRPRCKAGLFSFLVTVDFWSLQQVICLLDFSPFSQMFVTFRHLNILCLTSLLRSFYGPLRFLSLRSFIMKQRIRGKWGFSYFTLFNNKLPSTTPGGRPGRLLFRQGGRTQRHQLPLSVGGIHHQPTYNIPLFPL